MLLAMFGAFPVGVAAAVGKPGVYDSVAAPRGLDAMNGNVAIQEGAGVPQVAHPRAT